MTNITYFPKVIYSASTSTSTSPSDTPRPSSAGDEGGIAIVVENPSFLVEPSSHLQIVFGIAEKLVIDLGSTAINTVNTISAVGVKKDLEKLNNTVNTLKDVLLHAEELQANNPEMKTWLKRIKDAMYEADDIIDGLSIEALRKKLVMLDNIAKRVRYFSSSNPVVFHFKMARRIKEIRQNLDEINNENDKLFLLGFEKRVEDRNFLNAEREYCTHSYVDESQVLGREGDKEEIVKLLLDVDGEHHLSVIPIQGMAGLGKTTLAQMVCNDERVVHTFKPILWVYVAQTFDVKEITKNILKSATNYNECPDLEMDQLQSRLREQLIGKQFLLVLDDVWNEDVEKWDTLKSLLTGGAKGSKIIVTTRSDKVALITRTVPTHHLQELSNDACWKLFKEKAFETGQAHPNLVKIGKEIVEKCGGVPLAANALGSLMRSKTEEREWLRVRDDNIWRLCLEEIGMLPAALMSSYNHLSAHLRECFVYSFVKFPYGEIEKEDLIQAWVAQGYIHSSRENDTLEDIANEYIRTLMWTSFFQEPRVDVYGNLCGFIMHDLVREFAQFVAGTECFVVRTNFGRDIPNEVRHLFIESDSFPIDALESLCKASHLRTLLCGIDLYSEDIFKSFRSLRVLSLRLGSNIHQIPSSVSKLKHLRYLQIMSDNIVALPESITKLQSLQTLRLHCPKLEVLPRDIRKLSELRHIVLKNDPPLSHMPSGLAHLTSLRTLPVFVVGKGTGCQLNELEGLLHLTGDLTIKNLQNVASAGESTRANLKGKPNLRKLRFTWDVDVREELYMTLRALGIRDPDVDVREELYMTLRALGIRDPDVRENIDVDVMETLQPHENLKVLEIQGYGGARFPKWMMMVEHLPSFTRLWLPNIVDVSLSKCRKCEHLPSFAKLPYLARLDLQEMDALRFVVGDSGSGGTGRRDWFRSLKSLSLVSVPNLESWTRTEEEDSEGISSLPLLRDLIIEDCPKLTTMPFLPSLETCKLITCSEKLVKSLFPEEESRSLTSLASLEISNCESLTSLFGLRYLTSLPLLRDLIIENCPKLTTMPFLPYLETCKLVTCSKKLIQSLFPEEESRSLTSLAELEISNCESLTSLSGLRYLISLRRLTLSDCTNMHTLEGIEGLVSLEYFKMRKIPNLVSIPEGIQNATRLSWFDIWDCEGLADLPNCLGNFTFLRKLAIVGCPTLQAFPNGMTLPNTIQSLAIIDCDGLMSWPNGLRYLTSLTDLALFCSSKLPYFPEEMQLLTGMRYLTLGCSLRWEGMIDLPYWLKNFTSLLTLYIFLWPNLGCLPEWMQRLTALQELDISSCPQLTSRCQKDTGEDWPNIAHIPRIVIDEVQIQ